jgi:hypothetical protein
MALAGVVLLLVGGDFATGAGIVVLGSAVVLYGFSVFVRWSIREEGEREREEAARHHYREHGRWPDDG